MRSIPKKPISHIGVLYHCSETFEAFQEYISQVWSHRLGSSFAPTGRRLSRNARENRDRAASPITFSTFASEKKVGLMFATLARDTITSALARDSVRDPMSLV